MTQEDDANKNILSLMNILKKIAVTDELIKRNQRSMVGDDNKVICY